jgi:hypothetical protein
MQCFQSQTHNLALTRPEQVSIKEELEIIERKQTHSEVQNDDLKNYSEHAWRTYAILAWLDIIYSGAG